MAPNKPNASAFKMTHNACGMTAWTRCDWTRCDPAGDLSLVLQDDRLHVLYGTALNVRIHDGRVDFIAGSPADLRRALLSLTDEYETATLAGLTTDAMA